MYKLREIEKRDIERINKWRNDRELISYLGAPYRFINMDVDENWYDNYIKNRNSTIRCAITLDNNNDIIGLVTLANIDYINRVAELHIMIGNEYQNKGAGKYAVINIVNYAFDDLNLNRIELSALENNERAIGLYKKVGFQIEGIKKQAYYKEGKYINKVEMALLREEYNRN